MMAPGFRGMMASGDEDDFDDGRQLGEEFIEDKGDADWDDDDESDDDDEDDWTDES